MGCGETEHSFSIEMRDKRHVKSISMMNGRQRGVLFEGTLGDLRRINMIEGIVLEIECSNGVLRIDLNEEELRKALSKQRVKQWSSPPDKR